jgi:hypothetical protein
VTRLKPVCVSDYEARMIPGGRFGKRELAVETAKKIEKAVRAT